MPGQFDQFAVCSGWPARRGSGMLGVVDSELDLPPDRRREIDARLEAIRARLKTLRERESGWDAIRNPAAILGSRVAAAQRYAAEAHAAAGEVLASSAAGVPQRGRGARACRQRPREGSHGRVR